MKHVEPYLLTALVLVGFGLRLIGVADRPLDGDEGVILLIANGNISHVLAAAARDVHPPLFHLLTSLALAIDEVCRLNLRSVSVVAGTALVALGPALAHRLKANALLVTALLATSPFLIYLAQDARMYSLLACLAVGSWLLLLKVWDDATARVAWVGWAVVTLLMLLTHHLGWVVLVGELVATVVWHREAFRRFGNWIGATTLIIFGYLPILATTLDQVQGRLAETSLRLGLDQRITDLVGAFYRMLAGRTFLALTPSHLSTLASDHPGQFFLLLLTLVIPLGLAAMGIVRLWTTSRRALLDWALLAGVPVVTALGVASIADQAPRYLSFLAPVALVFVALGLQHTWPRWWGKIVALGLVATIGAGLWTQLRVHDRAPGLNVYALAIQSDLEQQSDSNYHDAVLVRGSFAGGEAAAFNFEAQQCEALPSCIDAGVFVSQPPKLEVVDYFGSYEAGNLGELRSARSAGRISELLASFDRVWFFDTTYETDPLMGLDPRYDVAIQTLGFDKEQQPLKLYLIERGQ